LLTFHTKLVKNPWFELLLKAAESNICKFPFDPGANPTTLEFTTTTPAL
jgi:hypothetical protein